MSRLCPQSYSEEVLIVDCSAEMKATISVFLVWCFYLSLTGSMSWAGEKDIKLIVNNDLGEKETQAISLLSILVDFSTSKTSYASRKITVEKEKVPEPTRQKSFVLFSSPIDDQLLIRRAVLMVQWVRPGKPLCEIRKIVNDPERSEVTPYYGDFNITLSDFPPARCAN